jgi:hypothetical protein
MTVCFLCLKIQKFSINYKTFSEITRLEGGGVYQGEGSHFLDIYREKCARITIRVLVPVREHPKVGPSKCL